MIPVPEGRLTASSKEDLAPTVVPRSEGRLGQMLAWASSRALTAQHPCLDGSLKKPYLKGW
jgi:hypothetical protein